MAEVDITSVGLREPSGETLGTVDRAVLTAGAAEGDLKVGEITFLVFFNALTHDGFHMVEKQVDGGLLLQKFDDGTILAGVGFVFGIAAWVGQRTTVEDETAAVAGGVVRETFLETEREDGDS